ncbi:ATP-binding cassette domain-containing protein [Kitasatospora sp. NPDC059722]|uniref:ATP-binding cassette domain-containing protein n=1 Tax=Kitasatospora sp. NPDC059722 TaxID=3346925 RepID=UPI0036AE5E1E
MTAGIPSEGELLALDGVGKSYGTVRALQDVSLTLRAGEISCVLGDNGAGKSTLIKIIAGLHRHDEGVYTVGGEEVRFDSPRQALDRGIATVYQDLAVVPLMPVWRNFFLGSERGLRRWGGLRLDADGMRATTREALARMGIDLHDVDRPIGTLSGGQRQCVAIARAVHFGAKVLILDEPTAALGVKQSGVVLKYVTAARDAGLGVVLITHNPHHAYLVGDHFTLLKRGRMAGSHPRDAIGLEQLTTEMAGGSDLAELSHELARPNAGGGPRGASGPDDTRTDITGSDTTGSDAPRSETTRSDTRSDTREERPKP